MSLSARLQELPGAVFLQPLPYRGSVSSANRQLAVTVRQVDYILAVMASEQSPYKPYPHQGVPVNPQQVLRIGVFQLLEGEIGDGFATDMVDGDAFLVGLAVQDSRISISSVPR